MCKLCVKCGFYKTYTRGLFSSKMNLYAENYCNNDGYACLIKVNQDLLGDKYMLPNGRKYNPYTGGTICPGKFSHEHIKRMEQLAKARRGQ